MKCKIEKLEILKEEDCNNKDIVYFAEYKDEYFECLYDMKKQAFKWYVENTYGPWIDKDQIKFFKDHINNYRNHTKIIKYNNEIIGLYTNYMDDNNENFIGLFYLREDFRGNGIGTKVLQEQLRIDKDDNLNTTLRVFKQNPARFLYEKVGFEIYEETEFHYKMIRKIK